MLSHPALFGSSHNMASFFVLPLPITPPNFTHRRNELTTPQADSFAKRQNGVSGSHYETKGDDFPT
jgi:hypothetical protein